MGLSEAVNAAGPLLVDGERYGTGVSFPPFFIDRVRDAEAVGGVSSAIVVVWFPAVFHRS